MNTTITKLLVGHDQFRREFASDDQKLFQSLAAGRHEPTALVIACCDARVVPDVILNAEPGDLFVLRNISNLVPAYGTGHHRSVGAAIEYAIFGLKVPHVIVCGHTQCGGLAALIKGHGKLLGHMPSLAEWLHDAVALRARLEQLISKDAKTDLLRQLVFENVVMQTENLLTYPSVQWAVARSTIQIHGWVYDLETGGLSAYDVDSNTFKPVGGTPLQEPPP